MTHGICKRLNRRENRLLLRGSICLILIILSTAIARCQEKKLSDFPKKGSYLYYGLPAFEDNSFLLEEAFNQPMGVIQHISNFSWDNTHNGNFAFSFTQEIPLSDQTHQLSYTLYYNVLEGGQSNAATKGFGDLFISYRPLVLGEKDWAMVIPRFTLILPTGNAQDDLGKGGWGGQFNLAVTKRLSRKIVAHYNAGFTVISKADKYRFNTSGGKDLVYEKDLNYKNLGTSLIWYPKQNFNLFLEYVSNFACDIEDDGRLSHHHQLILNPGMRFCIDNGRMQIVPGISIPINFEAGNYDHSGLFFYLSFEPDYRSFYKPKSQ